MNDEFPSKKQKLEPNPFQSNGEAFPFEPTFKLPPKIIISEFVEYIWKIKNHHRDGIIGDKISIGVLDDMELNTHGEEAIQLIKEVAPGAIVYPFHVKTKDKRSKSILSHT